MLTDPKVFTQQELQWLQSMLQQMNENQDVGTDAKEHALLFDFLLRVRAVLINAAANVVLTAEENEFFQNLVEGWREGAGLYQFQGPFGSNNGEGAQFPDAVGIDTVYGTGLSGSFYGQHVMQQGANVINDILHKLRE